MIPPTYTVCIYNRLNMVDSIEHGLEWHEVEEVMELFHMDGMPGQRIEITMEDA